MLKPVALLLTLVMFAVACGSSATQGPESINDEVSGLYVVSTGSTMNVSRLAGELTMAQGAEAATAAGFRVGIGALVNVFAREGMVGYRIEFRQSRSGVLIDELVAEAEGLGMTVERVMVGQLWPNCAAEPVCDRASYVP